VAVATCVLDNREISVTVATSATNDDSSTVTSTSMPDTAVFVEVGRPIKCYLYRTVRLFFFVYIFLFIGDVYWTIVIQVNCN